MNNLDREILLAEQKLRAQKLLKKSLDQVQSLDTESFALNPLLKKPKTAFVNPHFKPKVDLPVMNVVPLNVAGQPLVVNQSVPTAPTFLSAAPPLVLQRPLQPKVILPMSPVNISPIAITKPVQLIQQLVHEKPQVKVTTPPAVVSPIVQSPPPITPTPPTSTSVVEPPTATTAPAARTTTPTPEENCAIVASVDDPTSPNFKVQVTANSTAAENVVKSPVTDQPLTKNIPCKTFPNCTFGERCMYLHPACKFAERCTNIHCIFSHNGEKSLNSLSSTLCKFYPNCMNAGCPYKHPINKSCRFGSNCTNTDCLYLHDGSTNTLSSLSNKKWVAPKPHISDRRFAVADNGVQLNPVTIVVTSTTPTSTPTSSQS